MATIRTRGKKKICYALYRDSAGKLIERTCKTADKKKAQQMADDWERLARPTSQMAAADQMRKEITKLHLKYLGSEAPQMSVKAFCDHWFMLRKGEVGPDSKDLYELTIERFLAHLGDKANDDMFKITKTDIVTFRDEQVKVSSAPTANLKLKVLRMIFRSAHDDGWIPENPIIGVKTAKKPAHAETEQRRPFSIEELQRILEACPNDEWRDIVIRTYYTGQRLRDIALMIREQEDLVSSTVSFLTGKTGTRVILPMHPSYVDYVLTRESGDDPKEPLHPKAYASVMARIRAGKPAATVTISGQFGRILAAAGLRDKKNHKKAEGGQGRSGPRKRNALVFHSARHSFVSHLAGAGVTKSVVMDMVGHGNAQVNAAYTHFEASTKQEAIQKLPDITKSKCSPKG